MKTHFYFSAISKIPGYYKSQMIRTEHTTKDAEVEQVFHKFYIRILRILGISTNLFFHKFVLLITWYYFLKCIIYYLKNSQNIATYTNIFLRYWNSKFSFKNEWKLNYSEHNNLFQISPSLVQFNLGSNVAWSGPMNISPSFSPGRETNVLARQTVMAEETQELAVEDEVWKMHLRK